MNFEGQVTLKDSTPGPHRSGANAMAGAGLSEGKRSKASLLRYNRCERGYVLCLL